VSDRQTAADLARSFDIGAADYRATTSTLGNYVYEYVARENLRLCLSGKKFERTLDAGGGVGKWIPFLCDYSDRVDLLDISAASVGLAREALAADYPSVSFACGDLEHMPYDSGSFEIVIAQGGVASYTPDPKTLLTEFHRVLRREGFLWLDGYNCVGWALEARNPDWKLQFAAVQNDLVFRMPDWDYPARMFHPSYLVEIVQTAGFHIVAEYGSVILVNSMLFEAKRAKDFDRELACRLCEQEVLLSRDPRSRGSGKNFGIFAERR
jgi:ubiquinone/menaquinone biosynthesis C-methylase UbiE